MNCSSCGKPNSDGVSFCEFCGANLRFGSTSNTEHVVARIAPAQPSDKKPHREHGPFQLLGTSSG